MDPHLPARKQHEMCICTMLRNQARFLREWVMYHARIGVQRWFIYDNNSDDGIADVVESLVAGNFNISRHVWPWIKTQEAGFAHCALRARDSCEWVGFIDVDEFFHLPEGLSLHNVLMNQSRPSDVAELRASCHNFGPSGLTQVRDGFRHVNMDRNVMVVNHYKYQVWEVFKEKFYRRVATYVSDWQQEVNVGSKDRAPGLGTKAVEPPDWSSKFCEVTDTGLKDRVLHEFTDTKTEMATSRSLASVCIIFAMVLLMGTSEGATLSPSPAPSPHVPPSGHNSAAADFSPHCFMSMIFASIALIVPLCFSFLY
ncbi:unnamed protein product [Ilex paraguariensis]|uniref:Glycosyltransferase family 92 protein n=1 Tax=Ilex paraguariensis TaxID=185542 RepID=A0ABC8R0P2_9AQUA